MGVRAGDCGPRSLRESGYRGGAGSSGPHNLYEIVSCKALLTATGGGYDWQ